MPRKYTHIKAMLPEIKEQLKQGKSHREIEKYYGLEGDRPIHNLLKRERKKEKNKQRESCPSNEIENLQLLYKNTNMKTSD